MPDIDNDWLPIRSRSRLGRLRDLLSPRPVVTIPLPRAEEPPEIQLRNAHAQELERIRKQGRCALGTALATAVLGGVFTLGSTLSDQGAASTDDSGSVCAAAYANVGETLDRGIRNPLLLERVNPEKIDKQCGEETDIANDILDGER